MSRYSQTWQGHGYLHREPQTQTTSRLIFDNIYLKPFTNSKPVARIAGIDIPREKRVEIALTYIYGIGLTRSKLILSSTGVNPDIRVKDLSDSDVQKLRGAAEDFTVEGDLRRQEGMALKRLQDIGCVRGRRHRMSLPVRGQRTRTNARTRRGSRKTVAGRKK